MVEFARKSRLVYKHDERHYVSRTGWLRAAVLGANDGIISVSSLVVGVAAAAVDSREIMIAGLAGLVAGAMSMAAGEYVSVSSQSDLEKADLAREQRELIETPEAELQELTDLYIDRGLRADLAQTVAQQLTAHDALGTHAREELGISEITTAQPLQAALASGAAFSCGAFFPLLWAMVLPANIFAPVSSALSLVLLGILGAIAARAGGASALKPALRVMFWGAAAMGFTALIGSFFGTVVG
ncbi:MAG: VIT family protein [Alphaproteobacteria bacterium]|nr:VIT family protein [Alphaproteobacteria bacterium]